MDGKKRLALSMFIFGSIGIFVRQLSLPASIIVLGRGLIGAVFLILISRVLKKKIFLEGVGKEAGLLFLSGAALGCNWIFLFEAYRHTTIAIATLSYYLAPVIIVIASAVLLRERVTGIKVACVAVSLVGMALVSGIFNVGTGDASNLTGVGFGIAAAASYATLTILNKYIKGLSSVSLTVIQLLTASLVMLPYALMKGDFAHITFDMGGLASILILGIVHTGVGFWLYFSAVQELSGQTLAVYSYIDPVTAILLSTLLLKEQMGWMQVVGAFCILGATICSELFGNIIGGKGKINEN